MIRSILFLFLSGMFGAMSLHAQTRLLSEFSPLIDRAASVLKTQADQEASQAELEIREAQQGWELFGSVAAGYQKSPFAREPFGRFFDPTLRLGLRYPLLGSAERQNRAILDATARVAIETIRLNWSRHLAIFFIEENYAAYWSAQQLLKINDSFAQLAESTKRKLEARRTSGLLLSSDYHEFLSAFAMAERTRVEFQHERDRALTRLRHLTGEPVPVFESVKPRLDQAIAPDNMPIDEQPDLLILQTRIDALRTVQDKEKWQGIESDISATIFGGPAIPHPSPDSPQFGYGGAIGLNFRMPLEIARLRKNERNWVVHQLNSLQSEYQQRQQEIELELQSLRDRYTQSRRQLDFIRVRLDAAREATRERYLRLRALDGDVIEKYLQAIQAYHQAATGYLEAESEQWKLHIRLRQFGITPPLSEPVATGEISTETLLQPLTQAAELFGATSMRQIPPARAISYRPQPDQLIAGHELANGYGSYVWNYALDWPVAQFLDQCQQLGVRRVLLSLSAAQIDSIAANSNPMNQLLDQAHRRGIKVELLLGDPGWIVPSQRTKLLVILQRLRHIGFDGLHLDIEPDQLEDTILTGKNRLAAWLETVQQAKTIVSWPVGVSIHPRYLDERHSFGECVPCQFAQFDIREVTVMFYSRNLTSITSILQGAMQKYPSLIFTLAQSLERDLGPESSYAGQPVSVLQHSMKTLESQLGAPNFGGIIIQSWQDMQGYFHENPL